MLGAGLWASPHMSWEDGFGSTWTRGSCTVLAVVSEAMGNNGSITLPDYDNQSPLPGNAGLEMCVLDDLGIFRPMIWPEGSDV